MALWLNVNQDVTIGPCVQQCTVTNWPITVDTWIIRARRVANRLNNRPLMVGINEFGINDASILVLCVGTECLIYQIRHAPMHSNLLKSFLMDENIVFAGVNVKEIVTKFRVHGLEVNKTVDLGDRKIVTPELHATSRETIGFYIPKPEYENKELWESQNLSKTQIEYACVDVFISYKLAEAWKLWQY